MESQNVGSSTGSGSVNTKSTDNAAPLWNYVTKLDKKGALGGTWRFQCNFCTDYSRVRAHLLQIKNQGIAICKKVIQADKIEMQRIDDEFEARKNDSSPREVPLPCESTWTTSDDGLASKKRKPAASPIARAFGVEARDQLSQEIARMFYTRCLPFNLARNPHYIRSYTFAATLVLNPQKMNN
uniref:BED-type domain-containing protein n=1 Tax=Chenopodium quinoa TaxID=63459 RepID=A0A803MM65_CHEQI